MNSLTPAKKGLITGSLMIIISIIIFRLRGSFENNLQYITYLVYLLGIIWTIKDYKPETADKLKFKNYFGQGFKFFIVVTLLMVIFTFIFVKLTPQIKAEMAVNYQADLQKRGNLTPAEISKAVEQAKNFFLPMILSVTIFGYLLIGTLISILVSLFFSRRQAVSQ